MSAMNTLDKDRLKDLIKFLQLADKVGFSSLSSPTELLLEIQIDLALLLDNLLREGQQSQRTNKSVRFSEIDRDALGNPKQISFFEKKRYLIWSPEAADFYKSVALFSATLKRENSFEKAFAAFRSNYSKLVPPKKIQRKVAKTRSNIPWKHKMYFQRVHRRQKKRKT